MRIYVCVCVYVWNHLWVILLVRPSIFLLSSFCDSCCSYQFGMITCTTYCPPPLLFYLLVIFFPVAVVGFLYCIAVIGVKFSTSSGYVSCHFSQEIGIYTLIHIHTHAYRAPQATALLLGFSQRPRNVSGDSESAHWHRRIAYICAQFRHKIETHNSRPLRQTSQGFGL